MHYLFAWRYFKAKKSTNAINIISWVSIMAIIIGTSVLILVLSVFNGFEDIVKSLYSSFYTDLKVSPASGKVMQVSPQQLAKLDSIKGVKNFARVIEEKALVQNMNSDNQSVVYLKGVDEEYRYVTGVADALISGEYDLGETDFPKLILGAGVEYNLGIQADRNLYTLKIYLPRKSNTEQIDVVEDISNDTIRSSASFLIQQDFDNKYGITNIEFVRRALKWGPNDLSGIEIRLSDPSETASIKKDVQEIFGDGYIVQNRYEQNRNLYSIMNVERWAIYGILSLVLVVAAFTMIGALTMLVLEKQKDISVLHALGADRSFIRKIFLSEGILLAVIGGVTGMIIAFVLCWAQVKYHLIPLEGGSFLIEYFPVKIRWQDFALVGGTVMVIALIASWIPSRRAGLNVSLREF
jgi:lipoprotein-releasing system permease protein